MPGVVITIIMAIAGFALLFFTGLGQMISVPASLAVGILIGGLVALLTGGKSTTSTDSTESESSERKTVFVGNLWFKATEARIREVFEPYGQVYAVRIMIDRDTRRPRGYGFVEMEAKAAEQAIKKLDGEDMGGRAMSLSVARERANKD